MKKKEKLTPDFIQIPYQLIGDKTLAPIDRLVYGAVYFYSKMRGERCYATNAAIASLLASTSKTISRSLQKLEDRRYIMRGFSDPDTKVNRVEIIPLVAMGRLNTRAFNTPNRGVTGQSISTPNGVGSTPNGVSKYPKQGTPILEVEMGSTEDETALYQDILDDSTPSGGTPNGISNREGIENIIENSNKEQSFDPPGRVDLVSDSVAILEESSGSKINDAIALFLPYFPGDFVGKSSAFAKPPTRKAVEALLKRYSLDDLKILLQKYDSKKTDKFRPEAGTVYEFCTHKLAKIESFLGKSAGGLWAHRAISTPEQAKVREGQYQKVIDESREKTRKAKEDWLKDHPEEA